MTEEDHDFVQQLLEHRDELYRETARLKSRISELENFETEKAAYDKKLNDQAEQISKLTRQVEMLQRRIWGKSSEKYISEDPQQRKLDFDGLDLLPEEKAQADHPLAGVAMPGKFGIQKPVAYEDPFADEDKHPDHKEKAAWRVGGIQ